MDGPTKFRPYFTAPELLAVIRALKFQSLPSNYGLIRYLETFAIKIERGVLEPSLTNKPSIEQRLGLVLAPTASFESSIPALAANYNLFPDQRSRFSPPQLEAIQSHRFLNDMMSPEEEINYVQSLPKS